MHIVANKANPMCCVRIYKVPDLPQLQLQRHTLQSPRSQTLQGEFRRKLAITCLTTTSFPTITATTILNPLDNPSGMVDPVHNPREASLSEGLPQSPNSSSAQHHKLETSTEISTQIGNMGDLNLVPPSYDQAMGVSISGPQSLDIPVTPDPPLQRRKSVGSKLADKFKGLFSDKKSCEKGSSSSNRSAAMLSTTAPDSPTAVYQTGTIGGPAYGASAAEPSDVISQPPPPRRIPTTGASDEELSALAAYDTVFIIDDSGSMAMRSGTHTRDTHWEQVRTVLSSLVEICAKFDQNGVDIYFLNAMLGKITVSHVIPAQRNSSGGYSGPRHVREMETFTGKNMTNPKQVMELFDRRYKAGISNLGTPTAEALEQLLEPYVHSCESVARIAKKHDKPRGALPKPMNVIVLTDGQANNNVKLADTLTDFADRLDKIDAPKDQLGIQFFQVGNLDGVQEFLAWLDNALGEENGVRDMIDTKSTEEMGEQGLTGRRILTSVLGAVNRKLDREMDWAPRRRNKRN